MYVDQEIRLKEIKSEVEWKTVYLEVGSRFGDLE